MLKKQNRLARISRNSTGKFFSAPLFSIKIYDNKENLLRFGIIVSKKVSKSAVVRNKTKRILRSSVEDFLEDIDKGKDIVFFAKKKLGTAQLEEARQNLKIILKQAGLIK